MDISGHPVRIVMAIAVVSSLLAEIRLGVKVSAVVWQMLLRNIILVLLARLFPFATR
jgi:hypothetical protein